MQPTKHVKVEQMLHLTLDTGISVTVSPDGIFEFGTVMGDLMIRPKNVKGVEYAFRVTTVRWLQKRISGEK